MSNHILIYLYIFIIFSIIGIIFEKLYFNKTIYLPIHGIAACILYYISTLSISIIWKIVIGIFIINLFECTCGLISLYYHGYKTWNYPGGTCKGYISLKTGIIWSIFVIVFMVGAAKMREQKI